MNIQVGALMKNDQQCVFLGFAGGREIILPNHKIISEFHTLRAAQGTVSEAEMLNIFLGTIIVSFNTARKINYKIVHESHGSWWRGAESRKIHLEQRRLPTLTHRTLTLFHCCLPQTINGLHNQYMSILLYETPRITQGGTSHIWISNNPPPLLNPKVNPVGLA